MLSKKGMLMAEITRTENFLIRVPDQELYILPVYHLGKGDPNVQEFLSYIENADDRARLVSPHSLGEIEEFTLGDGEQAIAVYLEDTDQEMVLASVLDEIFSLIEEKGCKDVAIAQLGIIEYGYTDETKWANYQSKKMLDFAKKHKGVNLTFVVPIDDTRPVSGEHIGDGILPVAKADVDDYENLPLAQEHHLVSVPIKQVGSYADYFRVYIYRREQQMFVIRPNPGETFDDCGIHSLRDLQRNLAYYEGRGGKNENFSKWNKPVKDKKTGALYYPVPSKQKLKLIIAMLDMSLEEAEECLHFFGYSLAHFDEEDQAFKYILQRGDHWPKPLDIVRVNATLKKRYGKKAALYVDHKKGKK